MRNQLLFLALLFSSCCWSQWTIHETGTDHYFHSADRAGQVVLVASDKVVYRSTDGGATWTFCLTLNTPSPTNGFKSVAFADANTVYCGGDEFVFKSTDAGANWTQLDPPSLVDDTWSVAAPSPNYAFFGRVGPDCFRTTNGGVSFSSLPFPASGIQVCRSMYFTSNTVGFAATGTSVYRTQNSGSSWSEVSSGLGRGCVYFPDAMHGCIVGRFGTILTTSDGGTTWTARASGTTSELRDVDFFDALNGIAVGENATIIRTVDGGTTWFNEPYPEYDTFETVVMLSPTSVVIGSQFGVIYTTGTLTLGIPANPEPRLLALYPNPVTDVAKLSLPSGYQGAMVEVTIWDQLGHQVFDMQTQSGSNELTVDLSELLPGAYYGVVRTKHSVLGYLRMMRIP